MNKLTTEKCRQLLEDLKYRQARGAGLTQSMYGYKLALEIALPILEQQERKDVFIVVRKAGHLPYIKRPVGDVADYLLQIYQQNPEVFCDVVTYRFAGASGQWVQDGKELLAELEIEIPATEKQERGEGEWVEWKGGECPVESDLKVDTRLRCGLYSDADEARLIYWNHTGRGSDVIAYRIIPERATNQNGEQ
ncbi:hypothetical protein [Pantoea vagans]|uniref:hypothetical protein n=1 Tax=Pantoea vagans TaxID=470934 RepID=UPI00320A5490